MATALLYDPKWTVRFALKLKEISEVYFHDAKAQKLYLLLKCSKAFEKKNLELNSTKQEIFISCKFG